LQFWDYTGYAPSVYESNIQPFDSVCGLSTANSYSSYLTLEKGFNLQKIVCVFFSKFFNFIASWNDQSACSTTLREVGRLNNRWDFHSTGTRHSLGFRTVQLLLQTSLTTIMLLVGSIFWGDIGDFSIRKEFLWTK
jgi:hypothetical protein